MILVNCHQSWIYPSTPVQTSPIKEEQPTSSLTELSSSRMSCVKLPDQVRFRDILFRLRNAEVTTQDWQEQTPTNVQDLKPFANALHLYPTVEAVVEYNITKLKDSLLPPSKQFTLEPMPPKHHLMMQVAWKLLYAWPSQLVTSNLWVETGLVNGAMGTIEAVCYRSGDLPLAVMVKFDHYTGPTLHDTTVPITPLRRTWSNSGVQCSRLQLPLKLAWAHKSQGLTLRKVVVDIGKKEFCCGLSPAPEFVT